MFRCCGYWRRFAMTGRCVVSMHWHISHALQQGNTIMTFNDGEYGSLIRLDLGQDISAGTSLTVELQPQRGDTKTFTSNVAIGTSNTDVDDQTFTANEFVAYTLQDGDLDFIGMWRARATAIVSGVLIKGDFVKFVVLP